MGDVIRELHDVILERKHSSAEGSYTGYLFSQGLDKILKKCGEECSEVLIAAKSLQAAESDDLKSKFSEELKNEICDLTYHLLVLIAEREIEIDGIESILRERSEKTGNLKDMKKVDKNT
jgi:phosphoribosyl-ATP pyrophosphohydrolase